MYWKTWIYGSLLYGTAVAANVDGSSSPISQAHDVPSPALQAAANRAQARQANRIRDSAVEMGVEARHGRLISWVKGVPSEMRNTVINDARDIEDFTDVLADYFGFVGNEQLSVYPHVDPSGDRETYHLSQRIDNVGFWDRLIKVRVDSRTGLVTDVSGEVFLAVGIDSSTPLTDLEALDAALGAVEDPSLFSGGAHRVWKTFVLENGVPTAAWVVQLFYSESERSGRRIPFEPYFVYDKDKVRSVSGVMPHTTSTTHASD